MPTVASPSFFKGGLRRRLEKKVNKWLCSEKQFALKIHPFREQNRRTAPFVNFRTDGQQNASKRHTMTTLCCCFFSQNEFKDFWWNLGVVRMSGWPSGLRRQTQEIASSFYWAFCSTIVGVGSNPTSDKILFTQQTMKWENQTISFPNKLEGIFFYHRPLTSIEFLLSIIFSVRRHSNASLASTSSWPSPFFVPQVKQRQRSLLEQKHVLFLISGRGAKNLDMPLFFQDITFPTSQAWEIIKQFT